MLALQCIAKARSNPNLIWTDKVVIDFSNTLGTLPSGMNQDRYLKYGFAVIILISLSILVWLGPFFVRLFVDLFMGRLAAD
jgi:hypothetical protein